MGPGGGHGRPGRARAAPTRSSTWPVPGWATGRGPRPQARGHGQPGAGHHHDRARPSAEHGVPRCSSRRPASATTATRATRCCDEDVAARVDATSPTSRPPGRPRPSRPPRPASGWCRRAPAVVLSAKGGAYGRLLPLFRLGLGGRLGSGRQWWSWIALDDYVRAVRFLLDHDDLAGPVNITAPEPLTNAEMTAAHGPRAAPADAVRRAGVGAEGAAARLRRGPARRPARGARAGCWTPASSSRTRPSSRRCARCWPRVTPAPRRRPATGPPSRASTTVQDRTPRPGRSADDSTADVDQAVRRHHVGDRQPDPAAGAAAGATEVAVRRRPSARSPAPVNRARTCWSRGECRSPGA